MSTMRAGADEKEALDANCCVESAVVRIEHALDVAVSILCPG
jgi:hypothetical protein